jgi:amino-acid N-acetyltransferase
MNTKRQIVQIKMRRAVEEDRDAICGLLKQVKLPTGSIDTKNALFFVGEIDGRIAAMAGFEFYGSDALLRSVAVRPELQRKGLGDQVADFMITAACVRHVRRIVLLTETAQAFFERKGFRVVDRSSIVNDEMKRSSEFTFACPVSAVCMILDL